MWQGKTHRRYVSVHQENNDFYDRCPWDLQSFPFAVRIQVYVHFTLKDLSPYYSQERIAVLFIFDIFYAFHNFLQLALIYYQKNVK